MDVPEPPSSIYPDMPPYDGEDIAAAWKEGYEAGSRRATEASLHAALLRESLTVLNELRGVDLYGHEDLPDKIRQALL